MNMRESISYFGRKAVSYGLVEGNMGNISVLVDGEMLITKTGMSLDEIGEGAVIAVSLEKGGKIPRCASMEAPVHLAVYEETDSKGVIHTHSPYAVSLSVILRENGLDGFVPKDIEGKHYFDTVPVVESGEGEKAGLLRALRQGGVAIVAGHGAFTRGKGLEEAFNLAVMLEHSAKVGFLYGLAKGFKG